MEKETGSACGWWFLLVAFVGPLLLFGCYRTAHGIYDYHMPGGHHFGGGDLAAFDAFVKALMLGPLLGIALTIITRSPRAAPRRWLIRSVAALAFACFPLGVFAGDLGKYRARDLGRQLIRKADADPQLRQELVGKAQNGTISRTERWALIQAIYSERSFPAGDIPFLIGFFMEDVSIVDPLLRYESVTEEAVRAAYEAHKLDDGHSRISEVLVEKGRAPIDILEDIAEHNSRYPRSHQYSEQLVEQARQEIERKKTRDARMPATD